MYGYEVRNGVFTIIPEEAEVVRRIFRMYLDGMGSVRIMKTLIAEGIPAPEGGLWNASVIMMMLRNEKYAGDIVVWARPERLDNSYIVQPRSFISSLILFFVSIRETSRLYS